MLEVLADVFGRMMDLLALALAVGCVWLGGEAVLRPGRSPDVLRGPVWVVRAWGVGYVLLGVSLVVETVTLMTGGEPGWATDLTRGLAGPLVVGSLLVAFVARRRKRRTRSEARERNG
ncbi:hypothetical protein ACFUGD_07325 [Streptomyces sp. NPDC057217]|uniref:hypothetical protein n=1 Tax=unclassified Streptomyces TaxID=2593676 RepID=UPI00363A4425